MDRIYNRLQTALAVGLTGLRLGASYKEKIRLAFFLCSRFWGADIRSQTFVLRVLGRPVVLELRNNFADVFVLHEAFIGHEYDAGLPKEGPDVIFDIGANVGFLTVYLKLRYPHARVFCFEPDPDNFSQLRANTRQFSDVVCYQVAVGGSNGQRVFYKNPIFHMRNSLIPMEGGESFAVEVVSLDEAIRRSQVTSVGLLKFDIEGAEGEMFGGFNDFQKVRAVVGELHPSSMSAETFSKLKETLSQEYKAVLRSEHQKVFLYGKKD